mmetsp:Transcript_9898/g.12543  ORF Transcript_9898/g.12543 Transcript_9898/m.12543 type:complete len:463 (-) Transcript_9898:327-1715(-)
MHHNQATFAYVLLTLSKATSFQVHHYKQSLFDLKGNNFCSVPLNAKAGTKKKKGANSAASRGGFGNVSVKEQKTKKKEEQDDYAAYPALDDKIKQTLISSNTDVATNVQDLSQELYDRLGGIYGFDNFNYPEGWFDEDDKDDGESNAMSLNEILSSGGDYSKEPKGVSSDFSDLLKPSQSSTRSSDVSDLIASATGGATSNQEKSNEKMSETSKLNISNIQAFSKFRVLNVDPMVLAVDDFLTCEECDKYVDLCRNPKKRTSNNDMPLMSRSKTVGKDSSSKAQRTSTTWFHHFKSVPELVAKATRLMGLDTIDRWEEPQTVRYQQSEKFTWHLDALAPSESLNDMGGQRVATLLVYLTDVGENNGGSTMFRDLGGEGEKYLKVQPKKGTALLFFPAAGGVPNTPFDIRTLHAGEALAADAPEDKWIAQMWLRENSKYQISGPPGNSHSDATDAINKFCNSD